jgi:hypothetical protein
MSLQIINDGLTIKIIDTSHPTNRAENFHKLSAAAKSVDGVVILEDSRRKGYDISPEEVSFPAGITTSEELRNLLTSYINDTVLPTKSEVAHRVELGQHFKSCDYDDDVDSPAVKEWLIKTPNTLTAVTLTSYRVTVSLNGLLEVFKDPTVTSPGTAIPIINSNFRSSNTPETLAYKDPTIATDGDMIDIKVIGTDSASPIGGGGGASADTEKKILDQDQYVLVRYTPEGLNNRVSVCLEWYEV